MASTSRTNAVAFLLAVSATALFLQAEGRFLLHAEDREERDHPGQINSVGNRLIFNDPIPLDELTGLWVGDGNQYSADVWAIFEVEDETSLPNCTAHPGEFNYEHFGAENEQSIMVTGKEAVYVAHHGTYPYTIQNYTNNILGLKEEASGESECISFRPYVDLRTGDLKAEVINMALYSLNATGYRQYQSLSCQVVGNELPGCYTSQVARSQAVQPQVQAASVSASPPTPQISIPAGAVVSVDIETYTCRNGECSNLAPKFASEEEDH